MDLSELGNIVAITQFAIYLIDTIFAKMKQRRK